VCMNLDHGCMKRISTLGHNNLTKLTMNHRTMVLYLNVFHCHMALVGIAHQLRSMWYYGFIILSK
jgi:cell division protein FtsL